MKPQRIQLRRAKGWRMPPNTVKVDRTSPWGNPFVVGRDGTRAECVRYYDCLMGGYINLGSDVEPQRKAREYVAKHARERLRGKNLACWCPPGAPCHADTLLRIANHRGRGRPRVEVDGPPLQPVTGGT